MEDTTRISRGNLFGNWDLNSDEDSLADEELGSNPDPDVMTTSDGALGDGMNNSI